MAQQPPTNTRPDPDPTVLTTQQLDKAVAALREIFEAKLRGVKDSLESRVTGMDRAIGLVEKYPTAVDVAVGNLKALHDERFETFTEKFHSIAVQFEERDTRAELKRRGITTAQLAEKLGAIGISETERNLNNKISRGGFTAAFLLQCMNAIGANELRL